MMIVVVFVLFFVDFLFRVHTEFGMKTQAGFKCTRFTTQFLNIFSIYFFEIYYQTIIFVVFVLFFC